MDSTSIITILLISLIGISLIVAVRMQRNKRTKEALAGLAALANDKGCTITCSDYWKGYRTKTKIAVDSDKMWLFFIREVNGIENDISLDLSEIKRANLLTRTRSAGEGKHKQTVVDVINLELSFKTKIRPAMLLDFYFNEYDGLQLNGELQFAEKWAILINQAIESK